MENNYFKPIIISTVFIVFLLLFNIIKVSDKNKFFSLNSQSNLIEAEGYIKSSPVKLSNNKYYSAQLQCKKTKDINNYISECKGELNIYIPAEMVEAYFPGKIYSKNSNKNNYLFEEGGYYKFSGYSKNNIFFITECMEGNWNNQLYFFRANLRINFKRLMYKWGKTGGLFMALLTGAREYTDESIKTNFRKSGLSHILALSGMHLSLLTGIAGFIGNKIKRLRVSYIIRILSILFFVFIAGFTPSLLRAFISFTLMLFYSLINNKKRDMIFIVCLTFIIQINISPVSVLNAGFILSYGALFGILLLSKLFNNLFSKILPDAISNSLSASTSAQIFTMPFSISIFGTVYPVGIISSVIVSPLVTIFIYLGIVLFLLSLIFPFFSEVSGFFMNLLYTIISFLVEQFSKIPEINFI